MAAPPVSASQLDTSDESPRSRWLVVDGGWVVDSSWKLGKMMTVLESWVGDYSMKRVRESGWS